MMRFMRNQSAQGAILQRRFEISIAGINTKVEEIFAPGSSAHADDRDDLPRSAPDQYVKLAGRHKTRDRSPGCLNFGVNDISPEGQFAPRFQPVQAPIHAETLENDAQAEMLLSPPSRIPPILPKNSAIARGDFITKSYSANHAHALRPSRALAPVVMRHLGSVKEKGRTVRPPYFNA
ncbi:MAG: hypothetical protein O9313_13025 [Acetobacteraceae bacterium]|nr:hypothetical protein [Acetobacteraceae bacterium]